MLFKRILPVLAALLAAATLLQAQTQPSTTYYLNPEQLPDARIFLPAPPDSMSNRFIYDVSQYIWGKQQRQNSFRAATAIAHATTDIGIMAELFSPAFGMALDDTHTPAIMHMLRRAVVTARNSVAIPKKHYLRNRPFAYFKEPTLLDKHEGIFNRDGSFPSGHTLRGMAMALILIEINPDAQNELLKLAYEWGESRVIAGYHWQSDVDASYFIAAGAVARLHAEDDFLADLAAAKKEYRKLKK